MARELDSAVSGPTVFVGYAYAIHATEEYRDIFRNLERRYYVRFVFGNEQLTQMNILEKVQKLIESSGMAIFDISGWNSNVFLELGYAMGIGKPWRICINRKGTPSGEAPADLQGIDRIDYEDYKTLSVKLESLIMSHYTPIEKKEAASLAVEQLARFKRIVAGKPGIWVREVARELRLDVEQTRAVAKLLVGSGEVKISRSGGRLGYHLPQSVPPAPNPTDAIAEPRDIGSIEAILQPQGKEDS